MKAAAVGLASLLLSATLIAQPDGAITATGTFRTEFVSFTVQSAIAYVGKSALDKSEPSLVVAISNAWVDPDRIADFVDRRRAIEKLINDGDTGVVYLEFTLQGAYRGLSYAFGPDDGCGFCMSEATSTVTPENGRLVGRVTSGGSNRPFDVNLEVSVRSDDHGAALPAGGGEPGQAFLAYHGSLVNRDPVALRSTISLRRVEVWNRASRGGARAVSRVPRIGAPDGLDQDH